MAGVCVRVKVVKLVPSDMLWAPMLLDLEPRRGGAHSHEGRQIFNIGHHKALH